MAEYAAETDIASVEVIRNNQVVHRQVPHDWKGRLEWVDTSPAHAAPIDDFASGEPTVFYYVRVTAQSDARAWSSPCWFM